MRVFILIFLVISSLFAGFASVHQFQYPKGLINKFKEVLDENGNPKVKYINDGVTLRVAYEAQPKGDDWCGPGFHSYKVYIPKGLYRVTVGAVARPNSSYFILYAFVPDGEDVNEKEIPFSVMKMIDAVVIMQKKRFTQSGWLYLRFVQASNFLDSQFGHINNPEFSIFVKYQFDQGNMEPFLEWLENTKFNSFGDPVDMFSVAYEKSRYCSSFGELLTIDGIVHGTYGKYLVSGLDPAQPKISVTHSGSVQSGSLLEYLIEYFTGEKAINSISEDINGNITDGILIEDKIDSCLTFEESTKVSGKDGYFVYSDDGVHWYKNSRDEAIADNIRYIGYFIEDDSPRDGNSEPVIEAKSGGKIKIVTRVKNDCLDKNSIINIAKIKFRMDGVPSEQQDSDTITIKKPSSTPSSGSSGGTSGGSSGGTSANNNSNVEDENYYSDGGRPSNNVPTNKEEGSDLKQECLDNGGKWLDGVCLQNSRSSKKSSQSSSSSSSERQKSNAEQECLDNGGKWLDGVCLQNGKSSNSSTSSSSSSKEKRIVQVITSLEEKELPVAGYFARFGDGAFDWMYRTAKGKLYKLDGIDQRGYFQWTPLTPYFKKIELRDGKIILQKADTTTRNVDKRVLKTIEKITQKSVYPVNGYFTQYANGAFDWVYIDGQDMYKLEGLEPNGYFRWTPVGEYFQEVKVENYKRVIIGEIKKDKLCVINGGQWDEKRGFCFIYVASSSTSEESSSSRSSVNSSNSSNSSQTSSPFSSSSSSSSSSQKDEAGNGDFPSE